jgi:hypothetical protein
MRRAAIAGVCLAGWLAALATPLAAQRRSGEPDYGQFNVPYDGRFTFVRIRFTPLPSWGGGGGFWRGQDLKWDHDYPRAERNFTKILSELTAIAPYLDGGNILPADDPELFKYPVAYLCEPGFWTVTDAEAENLRRYLLKGGFLIVDDFGGEQWFNFEEKMRRVLPDGRLVPLDASHPVFHSFFDIGSLENLVSYYGGQPQYYGIFQDNDPAGRLMVIVNYNNDIGEYWEWSDQGFYPIDLSNEAYKLGVNYVVYAMTH